MEDNKVKLGAERKRLKQLQVVLEAADANLGERSLQSSGRKPRRSMTGGANHTCHFACCFAGGAGHLTLYDRRSKLKKRRLERLGDCSEPCRCSVAAVTMCG
jgi:hypothetical protein